MNKRSVIPILIVLAAAFPASARAGFSITEIMYDVSGTDDGREWIEVRNDGNEAADLAAYKLREGGVNHGITAVAGSGMVPAGFYAVIADDPAKFSSDNSAFGGMLFDSSFSLSNAGEEISLRFGDSSADSVSYSSGQGAAGDGNSLQKRDGAWLAAFPTPGGGVEAENTQEEQDTGVSYEAVSGSSSAPSSVGVCISSLSAAPVFPKGVGSAIAGSPVKFSSAVYGPKKEKIDGASVDWVFGDGGSAFGQEVSHAYLYPGEYAVSVRASCGGDEVVSALRVSVISSPLVISDAKTGERGYIKISNSSSGDMAIGGFFLRSAGRHFMIPERTVIGGKRSVIFPYSVTGVEGGADAALLYPDKTVAYDLSLIASLKKASDETKELEAAIGALRFEEGANPAVAPVYSKDESDIAAEYVPLSDKLSSEEKFSASGQEAAVRAAYSTDGYSGVWRWVAALSAVLASGAIAVTRSRRSKGPADDFTIR